MHQSSTQVQLEIRGRGRRTYCSKGELLVSPRGAEPPRPMTVGDIRAGDYAGIEYGGAWLEHPSSLPRPPDRALRGSEKTITYPSEMTDDLAFLLGAYMSEGHTTRSNWSVILTNSVIPVLERAQQAWSDVFGLQARLTRQPGRCTGLVVSSKRLVEYMDLLGCGSRAANKRVPAVICRGSRTHCLAFLQGVALDAYTTHTHAPKWAICLESELAILELQDLLTRMGVVNAQIPKYNKQMDKTYYELYAPGRAGQELCRMVPFLEPAKLERAREYLACAISDTDTTDVIPGVSGRGLFDLLPAGRSGREGRGTGRQAFRHLCDPRTKHVSRQSVVKAAAAGAELPEWLSDVVAKSLRFAPVRTVMSAPNARTSQSMARGSSAAKKTRQVRTAHRG